MRGPKLPGNPPRPRHVSRGFCQTWDGDLGRVCRTSVEVDGEQSWTYCPRCFNKVRLIRPGTRTIVKPRRPPAKQPQKRPRSTD